MYKNLIIKYIPKITLEDVLLYSSKNQIPLSEKEAAFVLDTIQKEYPTLLSPNYMSVFEKSKSKLSKECYDKLLELYLTYQKKYKIF